MTSITFTQYLRPDGATKEVMIDRPDEIIVMARDLKNRGCIFEIEELMNGSVSMTVEYPIGYSERFDGAFAHKICQNGPKVPETVDALVKEAWEKREELDKKN